MIKNCRSCRWAEWEKTAAGRRDFGLYTRCSYPIEIKILPASRRHLRNALTANVSVEEYENKEINCEAWGAIPNKP